jgi:hypothetical protein
MPYGLQGVNVIQEFENVQNSFPTYSSSYCATLSPYGSHSAWASFDQDIFDICEEDPLAILEGSTSTGN